MKRSLKGLAKKLTVLAVSFLLLLAPQLVSAQTAPVSTFSYTDPSYQIIRDGQAQDYTLIGLFCDFGTTTSGDTVNSLNPSIAPPPSDPDISPVPGAPYCETEQNGSIIRTAADAFWSNDDATAFIEIDGDIGAAQRPPVRADSGLSGPIAKLHIFSNSVRISESDITIEDTTLTGQPVGSNLAPDLEGNCRQGAGVLSWLICPIINLATEGIKSIVHYVLELLKTEPLLVGTSSTRNGIYDAWNQFRTIANILLVPIFLISIYAMLFSANNRYTVTKLLPRLVIAALLMQISFYIAAFIIDIGNVMGAGIAGIFNAINESISPGLEPLKNLPGFLQDNSSVDRGVGAAVGVGLGVTLGWLFLLQALPALLIIVVAFVSGIVLTFLALALRQLAIVVFVVLAPIAFVLAVLPNMEKWMREWFDNLMKLVFIYPLIVLFFSVASTLSLLADSTGQGEVNRFMAALLPIIALVSVPLVFKFAGSLFRNITAALSGVSGRAKGGILGDLRDPGSLAFQARLGKLKRRSDNVNTVSDMPGLLWTTRFTKPARLERTLYNLGGESIGGVVGKVFPGRLKRVVWGERSFNGLLPKVEDYETSDLVATQHFRSDAHRIRRNRAEFTNIMMGPMAEYVGGHFTRGMNTLYGLGAQVRDGTMPRAVAEEGLTGFQAVTKGQQRNLSAYKFEDLVHPYAQSPRALYDLAFGDYRLLPGSVQGINFDRKAQFIRVGSGTLTEQQGEGTFRAMADTLTDDRIIGRARTDTDLRDSIEALVLKAESINAKFQKAGVTPEELEAMGGDEEVSLAGFYGKSGNEIRAMRDFVKRALAAKAALRIDTTVPRGDYF